MSIQTILIPVSKFSVPEAIKWINENNYTVYKPPHVTENFIRVRQRAPIKGEKYYTKVLPNGIELVFGESKKVKKDIFEDIHNAFTGGSLKKTKKGKNIFINKNNFSPSKEGKGIYNEVANRVNKAIGGKRHAPTGRLTTFLNSEIGNEEIESIKLGRKPIISNISKVLNVISLGAVNKKLNDLKYDDLLHNYLLVKTKSGKEIKLEKNHIVEEKDAKPSDYQNETFDISLNGKKLNIKELIHNASDGDRDFWDYSGRDNNCQVFTNEVISRNGLNESLDKKTLDAVQPQNTEVILDSLPAITKWIPDAVTSAAEFGDRVLHGDGIHNGIIHVGYNKYS